MRGDPCAWLAVRPRPTRLTQTAGWADAYTTYTGLPATPRSLPRRLCQVGEPEHLLADPPSFGEGHHRTRVIVMVEVDRDFLTVVLPQVDVHEVRTVSSR